MNKTKRDKIRNENMRDTSGARPVREQIEIKRMQLASILPNQPAARTHNSTTRGYRACGRPKKAMDRLCCRDTIDLVHTSDYLSSWSGNIVSHDKAQLNYVRVHTSNVSSKHCNSD